MQEGIALRGGVGVRVRVCRPGFRGFAWRLVERRVEELACGGSRRDRTKFQGRPTVKHRTPKPNASAVIPVTSAIEGTPRNHRRGFTCGALTRRNGRLSTSTSYRKALVFLISHLHGPPARSVL